MLKRVLVLSALLGVGVIGLMIPQVSSASPPNCPGTPGTVEQPPPEAPLAPSAASATTGCHEAVIIDEPDDVFLCYSKFQVEPGVWPPDVAAKLLADGYYYPVAVKGNVAGGTNLGDYHLVCNAPAGSTGEVVNENGEVLPERIAGGTLGYYPLGA
jgi:hypothetical protein